MSLEVGTRVFAVRDANSEEVNIFGFGVYVGLKPLPVEGLEDITNPCIELDDNKGKIYGFECWWGDEARFETDFVMGRKVNVVEHTPLDKIK